MFELSKIAKEYSVIVESMTDPTYTELIDCINPNIQQDKTRITPTYKMLYKMYGFLNAKFFDNELPYVFFTIENSEDNWFGNTIFRFNDNRTKLIPYTVSLNSKYRFTFHDWLETVLHECIHINDVMNKNEEYANGVYKMKEQERKDTMHGEEFKAFSNKFSKYGLYPGRSIESYQYDVNKDDELIKKYVDRYMNTFVAVVIETTFGIDNLIIIKLSDVDYFKKCWYDGITSNNENQSNLWNTVLSMKVYRITNEKCDILQPTDRKNIACCNFNVVPLSVAESEFGRFKELISSTTKKEIINEFSSKVNESVSDYDPDELVENLKKMPNIGGAYKAENGEVFFIMY